MFKFGVWPLAPGCSLLDRFQVSAGKFRDREFRNSGIEGILLF